MAAQRRRTVQRHWRKLLMGPGVDRWRQAAQDANALPQLTMAEQKDLEKRHQQDQREIRRLQQELRRKDRALAEAAALLLAAKKIQTLWGEDGDA